ncbi:MAG TPA: ATP-binding protein, partial [Ilumatobacteraceae bacterium]|nr:ATP-binding protein [Ilumatobacteraceae bacterium]
VIAEAVTNAVKHAEATRIVLRVSRDGDEIRVQVSDDGRGGAIVMPNSAISDRVAALGGRLAVSSPVGKGTTLEVALPCAS